MILISAVHIKRMRQMTKEQVIVCGEYRRLIPKIESYPVKEKFGRVGSLEKTLRSPIELPLVKLF